MRCDAHGLAAGPDGTCVRCRREESSATGRRLFVWMAGAGAAVLVLILAVGFVRAASEARAALAARPPVTADPVAAPRGAAPTPSDTTARAEPTARGGLPSDNQPASVSITLYSASWCPHCKRAKQWLAQNNLPYTERDVDAEPQAKRDLRRVSGGGAIPVFDVNGRIVRGFDPGAVQAAVRAAQQSR